jgi:hypothetical protein
MKPKLIYYTPLIPDENEGIPVKHHFWGISPFEKMTERIPPATCGDPPLK